MEFCWLRCDPSSNIDQFASHHRYPFTANEEVLKATFPGFLGFWNDTVLREPLKRLLSWYIDATGARSPDSSIVSGQTALELISWLQVVEIEQVLSAEGLDRLTAGDRFRLLLNL
jgi:hypothetical protein